MNLSRRSIQGRHFLLLCFFIVLSFPVLSQRGVSAMEKLAGQMSFLSKNRPPEMVYIQTSKGIYETLEDIWFKVYLLDGQTFVPSPLSQTLYLELLNENTRQVVWQEKYEVQNGFAGGRVFLNDTLSVGDYLLAAYSPNSFFDDSTEMKAIRRIQIRKELKPNYDGWIEPVNLTVPSKKRVIQFNTFPEGGNLVSGIQSKLAFKAVNSDGIPLDIQGTLFDDTVPLVKFKSVYAGMGSMEFTPIAGKKYHIRLLEPATDSIFFLPQVYTEGITIRLIARDKEFLEFIVSQSPAVQKKTVYLRGQIRGVVYCIARGVLNNELKIKIPLKEFPCQGIAEFTLFTDSLIPVAERVVYVNPGRNLHIETQLNKERYETKEKVILKITVKDENGQPVTANLGVSVYDKLYQNPADPVNILTYCYLTSQLRGKIYNPAYYFDRENDDRKEALDLLLLTQGWRRYVWGQTALKERGKSKQQVIFDGVEGEVNATAKLKKARVVQQIVKVFYPVKNENMDLLMADSTGKFMITPQYLKIGQGGYVYLKPLAPEEFEPRISLSDPFKTINEIVKNKEINYPLPGLTVIKEEVPSDPYVEGHKMIKLSEVTITGHGTKTFRDKYIGQLDSLAKLNLNTDYVGKCGWLNCPACGEGSKPIEGKVYATWVSKRNPGPHPFAFTANERELIEYHYPKFTEEELLKMNNLSRVKAYYINLEFYQPTYDKEAVETSLSDFRNTLVWAPSVITSEKGEATVEFFCSDINTRFVGTVEGISGNGLLSTESFEFAVLKTKPIK